MIPVRGGCGSQSHVAALSLVYLLLEKWMRLLNIISLTCRAFDLFERDAELYVSINYPAENKEGTVLEEKISN